MLVELKIENLQVLTHVLGIGQAIGGWDRVVSRDGRISDIDDSAAVIMAVPFALIFGLGRCTSFLRLDSPVATVGTVASSFTDEMRILA